MTGSAGRNPTPRVTTRRTAGQHNVGHADRRPQTGPWRGVHASPGTAQQGARGGFHPVEWGCEALGTALLLLAGLSAVCLNFGPHSALHTWGTSPRPLATGLLFAGAGSLLAISPIGRRSGAHLNPVVTLAVWTQHKVHPRGVAGYLAAQLLGATAGTGMLEALWGAEARAVHLGATSPGTGVSDSRAVLIEAAMTSVLVVVILLMTSSAATARWTPLVLWPLVATLVWQGAPYTGTSLNPARSLGPALLAPLLGRYWVYVAGALLGCALAVALFALLRQRHVLTATIYHDPHYASTLASSIPIAHQAPARSDYSAVERSRTRSQVARDRGCLTSGFRSRTSTPRSAPSSTAGTTAHTRSSGPRRPTSILTKANRPRTSDTRH